MRKAFVVLGLLAAILATSCTAALAAPKFHIGIATLTVSSRRSSLNSSVTLVGAVVRTDPSTGSDETKPAWASAGDAVMPKRSIATTMRTNTMVQG